MRFLTTAIILFAFIAGLVVAQAQNQTAAEKAASLRQQLLDVETKQADLQTRLQKLDEDMKPENIAANLAGLGSTKPEDLREQRRRQLEIERNSVKTQLDLLATSHTRLETAIARADAEAYRQSAAPPPVATTVVTESITDSAAAAPAPVRPARVRKKKAKRPRRVKTQPAASGL